MRYVLDTVRSKRELWERVRCGVCGASSMKVRRLLNGKSHLRWLEEFCAKHDACAPKEGE
jgi:hypothetical protein